MTSALATAPTASITCWRQGDAPIMWPAFRSCRLSPAIEAAQQTTAPIMMVATGPAAAFRPSSSVRISAANRIVQMVMPDTGLFDEPTRPAMYAETEQNTKPARIMMIVIATATPRLPTMA